MALKQVFNPLKEKSMATLLIETKVVKAFQVQLEDVEALLSKVFVTKVLLRRPARAEVLVDMGKFERNVLQNGVAIEEMNWELKQPTPLLPLKTAFQELVNRGELPEGHYLLNLGKKEEHDGGKVKPYVLDLQKSMAAGLACAAATDFEVI